MVVVVVAVAVVVVLVVEVVGSIDSSKFIPKRSYYLLAGNILLRAG